MLIMHLTLMQEKGLNWGIPGNLGSPASDFRSLTSNLISPTSDVTPHLYS